MIVEVINLKLKKQTEKVSFVLYILALQLIDNELISGIVKYTNKVILIKYIKEFEASLLCNYKRAP